MHSLLASTLVACLVAASSATKQIVVLKSTTSSLQFTTHLASLLGTGITPLDVFEIGSLKGYVVNSLTEVNYIDKDIVDYIEEDIPMHKKHTSNPRSNSLNLNSQSCQTQKNAPSWGLERTSSLKYPLTAYNYPTATPGETADVYVLDTGIRTTHKEFQGRASFAYNAAKGQINTDKDGHGTFVAGVLSAEHYGICKTCSVISVKIFTDDGDCSASIIIAGLNFVMKQVQNRTKTSKKNILINISVGGDPGQTSDAMDAAVNALVDAGVHVVTAAGNENVDACTESPARASKVIAVGSSMVLLGNEDYFLGGSNFGECVKLFAPGDKIVSLGIGSDTEVGVVDSGTSFSSPHVAGVLAELSMLYPNASLVEVQQLLFNSTLNKVIGGVPKGTANKLLHHGCAPSDTASGQATLPTSKDTTESFASFASRAGSAGGWKVGARSKPDTLLTMHIFVRHTKHSKDVLKDHLDQVSYPNSPNYGNHMSYQELNKLMKPPSTRIQTIYKWLKTHGVFAASIRTNPAHDILEFDMTVCQAEVLLSTEYYQLKNGLSTIHRSPSLQLPTQVVHHIDIVGPTTHVPHATSFQPLKPLQSNAAFTTPPSLRLQYGIESTTSKTTNSSLGIVGFLDQHFDPKDIAYFWKHFDNKISGKHGKITVNGPNSSPTGEEATLDVSYGSAMSNGLPITFWSTAGQQPGNPANEPFLQWLNDVAKNAAPPYVFSISYSDNENGVEVAFAQRVEVELQKAGARGITIIDSSGDGGVGGSQPDNSCKTFQPTFPASSPYVTAVGGTSGTGLKETASTVFPSGGGFSTLFPRPTYQMKMVDTYFSLAKNLPSKTLFNATGAAYPDVAMSAENFALTQFMVDVPVSGTSCSAPSFAAVVALLNDARMSKGKSSLGWINPLLYANADAFNDIVTGSNAGCAVDSSKGYLGTGFQCSPGFDPVTGLGSPIFAKLKALAIEL